jgi:hypothetical protein
MFKFRMTVVVELTITLARLFIICAFIVGAVYGFMFQDTIVMCTSIASALGLFALSSNNKSKEKLHVVDTN